MANTLITPTNVARAALATYQYNAVLPRVVNRNYVTEFGGGSGDTVTIRQQARLTTNLFDRATGVVVQDVVEGSQQLQVGDIYDATVQITQEQWDLDLTDFSYQVAEPMGKAIVRTSEEVIYDAMKTKAYEANLTAGTDSALDALIDLRSALTAEEVPLNDRVIVIGPNVTAELLKDPNLIKANEAGNSDALRNAQIGRLFGMPVLESVVVDDGDAWIVQREAVTFVSITPQTPRGAANAAVETFDNQAFRVVFGYDQSKKQDMVSGDAYLTAKVIRPEAIVGVNFV